MRLKIVQRQYKEAFRSPTMAVNGRIPIMTKLNNNENSKIEKLILIPDDFDFDKAFRSMTASFSFEGIYFRPEEKESIRQRLYGKITDEEYTKLFMEGI
jgi:hypothetical protein